MAPSESQLRGPTGPSSGPSESKFWQPVLLVERGRLAFELGMYLDAIATWELAWRKEAGVSRQLLQGLMQAAGAYRKCQLVQPLGMLKLLDLALERLEPVPDGFWGLHLDAFRGGLERSRREALAWASGGMVPGQAPSLNRLR